MSSDDGLILLLYLDNNFGCGLYGFVVYMCHPEFVVKLIFKSHLGLIF